MLDAVTGPLKVDFEFPKKLKFELNKKSLAKAIAPAVVEELKAQAPRRTNELAESIAQRGMSVRPGKKRKDGSKLDNYGLMRVLLFRGLTAGFIVGDALDERIGEDAEREIARQIQSGEAGLVAEY